MAKDNRPPVEFQDAADVAEKMKAVAALWRESPLMTGVNLRAVIPIVEAMAVLAAEIDGIKSRLPPPHKLNGASKRRKKK